MEQGNGALEIVQNEKPVLFDTKTPSGVIDRAHLIASTLSPLVEQAKLYSMISGRKYVKVEGWNTMLSMLGIFSHVEYSRKLDREGELAYEARVVLKTLEGKEVGSGEAICSSKERNWSGRDEFAIRSMAQTRATGKAARNGFSWIMSLAGYEATPAEEMDGIKPIQHEPVHAQAVPEVYGSKTEPKQWPHPADTGEKRFISDKQRKRLYAIWKNAGKADADVQTFLFDKYGISSTKEVTSDIYEEVCDWAAA